MIKTRAERVTGKELKPGDLFSVEGEWYWDNAMNKGSVGERVYIRTNVPTTPDMGPDDIVYRIIIEQVEDE
jgi:hypothetical protein